MRRRGWLAVGRRLFLKARHGVDQVRGHWRARKEARARALPLDKVHRRLELHEVLLQACNFSFMNRFTDGLRLPSEDEAIKIYRDVYKREFTRRQ